MCTYILLCWYLPLPCLLITVNVWIQAKGTSLFCWLQWTLLITVNVSTLSCHSGSSRDRASQSVITDRPGCWSTWHCYWLQWMYAGWPRPLFFALPSCPFAMWSTDYSERWYLKPHSGQSQSLWLSRDVLLITVNVLLNTVNLCWEDRRLVASATDYSERSVKRVMPLLMCKSRGQPAQGLSVIAYTLIVIVSLSRLGTGWRCKNAHSRLTTVNVY